MSMPPVGPPSVRVRPATLQDVSFLTELAIVVTREQGRLPEDFDEQEYRAGYAEWTVAQVEGLLRGSSTSVIEVDGEPAGRLRVVRAADHLELAGIQLLPSHQGQGLGTRLIKQFLVEAGDAALPAQLKVEKDNPRARALYDRLGFVKVGEDEHEAHLEWAGPPTTSPSGPGGSARSGGR